MTVAVSLLGAVIGCLAGLIPGLHVYSVMALFAAFAPVCGGMGAMGPEAVAAGFAGMIAGFAVTNTIPSVLLSAPDESAMFTVLPGQRYLMKGRGYEAVMLTTLGALGGLTVLLALAAPLAPLLLPVARAVLQPHFHWIIWCVIAFMLMSEWPKGGRLGRAGWRKFLDAWRSPAAGLLTFGLSGLLGLIVSHGSVMAIESAYQSLLPAFVGLFTAPWLILNVVSEVALPAQTKRCDSGIRAGPVIHGVVAGAMGGGFAAFVPGVTGGVGGFLAGHASALRDDMAFLVSQGASKIVYYAGGFLLLFVPGLNLARGGGAALFRSICESGQAGEYAAAVGALALAGMLGILSVDPLTGLMLSLAARAGHRRISVAALGISVLLVAGFTGLRGLGVLATASGIGLIPLLYGARRMNGLGVILLPLACNMPGLGGRVLSVTGLL